MAVTLVRSGRLYEGVPYAYASVAPRSSLIFTAGACPLDEGGEVVGAGDVGAQASQAMANLATALAESGATLADVLKTTVFVASAERAELDAAWDVVSAAFGEHGHAEQGARRVVLAEGRADDIPGRDQVGPLGRGDEHGGLEHVGQRGAGFGQGGGRAAGLPSRWVTRPGRCRRRAGRSWR